MFPAAIFPLFWTQDIGMSVATMMAVQGAFSLSIALFEFPSGYIADRLGHRRALVIASFCILAGWVLYALARGLWSVLLAELVLGVGFSLVSGADSALLFDSLREQGKEHEFARWYGRMRSIAQIASGSAALAAGFLYARWSRLPFAMEAAAWALAAGIALRFGETRRAAPKVEDHLGRMRAIVRDALFERADFRAVLLLGVVLALASYLPTWLMALYATEAGAPVAWIGPMWAIASFSTALGSMLSERAGRRLGMTGTLLACVVLVAAGYLGLALSRHVLGVAFYFLAHARARAAHAAAPPRGAAPRARRRSRELRLAPQLPLPPRLRAARARRGDGRRSLWAPPRAVGLGRAPRRADERGVRPVRRARGGT